MRFIKEFCPNSKTVVVRCDSYGSSLQMFQDMVHSAQEDGFHINLMDCKVVHYGGERYAKTFGIEFSYDYAPENYKIIYQLEYTK